jgi:hypothetical protein
MSRKQNVAFDMLDQKQGSRRSHVEILLLFQEASRSEAGDEYSRLNRQRRIERRYPPVNLRFPLDLDIQLVFILCGAVLQKKKTLQNTRMCGWKS